MRKKQNFFSFEIAKARALLLGGQPPSNTLQAFELWRLDTKNFKKLPLSIQDWAEALTQVLKEAIPLGTPVGVLLREVQPLIRREEKLWQKLKGIEKQFGFQGALALILPWCVVGMTSGLTWNWVTAVGIALQALGLLAFYALTKTSLKPPAKEEAWVFHFLVLVWMRVLAGQSLWMSLECALKMERATKAELKYIAQWNFWQQSFSANDSAETEFQWPLKMPVSQELASLLKSLIQTGAPSGEVLLEKILQISDARQDLIEENLQALPTKISLVFCLFLTPALFFILLGTLWPTLSSLNI